MSTVEVILDPVSVDSYGMDEFKKLVFLFLPSPLVPAQSFLCLQNSRPASLSYLLYQSQPVRRPHLGLSPSAPLLIHPPPLCCMDAQSSFQSSAPSWQENQSSEPSLSSSVLGLYHAPSSTPPPPHLSGVDPTTLRSSTPLAVPYSSIPLTPSDSFFPPTLP